VGVSEYECKSLSECFMQELTNKHKMDASFDPHVLPWRLVAAVRTHSSRT